MFPIAAALCVGCAVGGLLDLGVVWVAAIGVLLCVVTILMLRFGVRHALLWLPVLGLAAVVGATDLRAREEFLPHYHLRNLTPDFYVITGTVVSEPTFGERRRFLGEPTESFGRERYNRVAFEIDVEMMGDGSRQVPFSGRLLVYVRPKTTPNQAARANLARLQPGARITFRGKVILPFTRTNPGAFDYRLYLRRKGIYRVVYIAELDDVLIEDVDGFSLPRFFASTRDSFAAMFYRNFDEDNAAFFCALLLGDRGNLSDETVENFSVSGAAHFLAISGLHLAIIVSVAYFILRLFAVPYRAQRVVLILLVIFYASMISFRPPIVRASIMIVVFLLGQLLGRRSDTLNTLALAAILILLWDPQQIFAVGFQLSFAAVFSIVVFTRRFSNPLIFGPGWLGARVFGGLRETGFRDYVKLRQIALVDADRLARARHFFAKAIATVLCASIAAWIGAGPLVAYYFGTFSPLVSIANLFLIGVVYAAITLGFVLMILSIFGGPFSAVFVPEWLGAAPLTDAMHGITGFFAGLSWRGVPQVALAALAAYYAGILLLPLLRRRRRWRLAPVALLLAAVVIVAWPFLFSPDRLEIAVLDVGHGSTSVVRFPDGRVLVYDCGTRRFSDVTAYTLDPYLRWAGITKIDAVVISHPHLDHFSGLETLLDTRRIGCVAITHYFDESAFPLWAGVAAKIRARGVPIVFLEEGATLEGFPEARFFLTPGLEPRSGADGVPDYDFVNETSVAMEIRAEGASVLFTGDMDLRALEYLHRARGAAPADLLIAPHHGSSKDWAAMRMLFEDCQPRVVAISADRKRKQMAEICRDFGAEPYNTAQRGAVIVTVRDARPRIRCFGPNDGEKR